MNEGLIAELKDFETMSNKEQHRILYKNLLEAKTMIGRYKFHQKVQYVFMGLIFASIGFLFKVIIK